MAPPDFRAACTSGDVDTVQRYVSKGGDVNDADREGNTGLLLAVTAGRLEVVQALLAVPGIRVDAETKTGVRPVHRAAGGVYVRDDPTLMQLLVGAGASATARSAKGWAPIHYCLFWGHASILLYLVSVDVVCHDFLATVMISPIPELTAPTGTGRLSIQDALALIPKRK